VFEMQGKVGDGALDLFDQTIDGWIDGLENIDWLTILRPSDTIRLLSVSKNR
jgi:hypothetical protein